MCVSYTKITGNVKSKHKQYDHWHSQDFSTGGQSEGAKRPSGGMVGNILHINFVLFIRSLRPINGGGGGGGAAWAPVPPYSYASDSGVARIC